MTATYISVDMEGVAGVTNPSQTRRGSDDYPMARVLMTREANAAVAGAIAAGATTVVVNDGHGDNCNILPNELDPRAELIAGTPKLDGGMVKGIEEGFDACLLVGYHARAGTLGATLDHTVSSTSFADVRVNGESWSEADLNCAIAGRYGVPVTLLTGDSAACEEVLQRHPDLDVVVTKKGYNHTVNRSLSPAVACARIEAAAERSVARRSEVVPFRPEAPFIVEVEMLRSDIADRCSVMPGTSRVSARAVSYCCSDAVTVRNLLTCFSMLGAPR